MRDTRAKVRATSPQELQIVSRLLDVEFPGAPELREQAKRSAVRTEDHGGVVAIVFDRPSDLPLARVKQRIPVEAEARDSDGVMIHFLLHVVDGLLIEVEIFREDSAPLRSLPTAGEIQTFSV